MVDANNDLDRQYLQLLDRIFTSGHDVSNRTDVNTRSVHGAQIRTSLWDRFPLLTTKKVWFEGVLRELEWFLRGKTNIKPLVDHGVSIWTKNAYAHYQSAMEEEGGDVLSLEEFENRIQASPPSDDFVQRFGDLGPIYGKQWRNFGGVDQVKRLMNDLPHGLAKSAPHSRRHVVSAWNPADISEMTLPPCHTGWQVVTRPLSLDERRQVAESNKRPTHADLDDHHIPRRGMSLRFTMRSTDVFLGLPFNLASYGLLAKLIAHQKNLQPLQLIYQGTDVHLYHNHFDAALEQLDRSGASLPALELPSAPEMRLKDYFQGCLNISGYTPDSAIKADMVA